MSLSQQENDVKEKVRPKTLLAEKKHVTQTSRRDKDLRKGRGRRFPAKPTRNTCESVDELDMKSGSDRN